MPHIYIHTKELEFHSFDQHQRDTHLFSVMPTYANYKCFFLTTTHDPAQKECNNIAGVGLTARASEAQSPGLTPGRFFGSREVR